jgi:hypothetical protein
MMKQMAAAQDHDLGVCVHKALKVKIAICCAASPGAVYGEVKCRKRSLGDTNNVQGVKWQSEVRKLLYRIVKKF